MRMGIFALLVIIFLVILLLLFSYYLENSINAIISYINEAEKNISEKNYKAAENSFIISKNIWDTKEKIYKLQIEHSELDKINELFVKMEAYFKEKGNEDFLKDSHTLKYFLTDLVSRNKVNLETIL